MFMGYFRLWGLGDGEKDEASRSLTPLSSLIISRAPLPAAGRCSFCTAAMLSQWRDYRRGHSHEKNISTFADEAEAPVWFPQEKLDQEWPQSIAEPAPQGSPAFDPGLGLVSGHGASSIQTRAIPFAADS